MLEWSRGQRSLRRQLLLLLLVCSAVLLILHTPLDTLARSSARALSTAVNDLRNRILGPPVVGLQIGHLDARAHPEELARLRVSTGGVGNGVHEVEVTESVAEALRERLEEHGIVVRLLPATVPPGFRADAFISLHADSSPSSWRRGYKSAIYHRLRNRWDARLKTQIDSHYLLASGLPDDDANVTGDMLQYYAFNRRYRHSLARSTPAVIVELGYLSHPEDLELLRQPELVADLLARGLVGFLMERGRLESDG